MTEKAISANQRNGQLGGRPPAGIPEDIREQIYEYVRGGVPPDTAAVHLGVNRRTYSRWRHRGEAENAEEPYATFVARIEEALAAWETTDILRIGNASKEFWTAAAWRLERRLPDRYGKRTKVDQTVTMRPVIDASKLTLDEQRQLLTLLQKAQPEPEQLPEGTRPALELMPGPPVEDAA